MIPRNKEIRKPHILAIAVKGLRYRENLTQKELAEKANLSISTIRRIEEDYGCSFESIEKITTALNVSIEQFLKDKKKTPQEKIIDLLDFTDIGQSSYNKIIKLLEEIK